MEYDKEKWGPGPWQNEPDRLEFEHAGLPCLMVRSSLGNWCGYAAVPPGHPFHGQHYDKPDVEAHGGLTYGGACAGSICHVPKPGEPDDVWWFGFDCAHAYDVVPEIRHRLGGIFGGDKYRNVVYVRHQVERLAEQLAAIKKR